MAITPRLLTSDLNLVKATATVLSADSAQQANPVRYLLDQLRSKVWRSDLGWWVIAGWNDKLEWSATPSPAATTTATITPGFYATGAALAAEIQTQLLASGGTWTVTYVDSGLGSYVFRFTKTVAWYFRSSTPTNPATIGPDVGVPVDTADDGSGSHVITGTPCIQGRHYIAFDFGVGAYQIGWVVVAGWNDKLDFSRAGTKVATIAPGTYATGAAMASALQTALLAADSGNNWIVSYSGLSKFDFSGTNAFSFLFASGANIATSIHYDIGFNTADTALFTSVSSDNVTLGSRRPPSDMTVAVLLGDNVSSAGSVRAQFSAVSILTALTAPTATETLTDQGLYWRSYFAATRAYRYAVLVINDIANTVGYAEAGVAFLGTYRMPSVCYSTDYTEEGDDLSVVERSTEGANLGDLRPEARAWQLKWEDISDASGDSVLFRAIRTATPQGKNWFLDFDPSTAGSMVYGYRDSPLPMPMTPGAYWSPTFVFREALP